MAQTPECSFTTRPHSSTDKQKFFLSLFRHNALIAQRIEQTRPKGKMEVRFPLRAHAGV